LRERSSPCTRHGFTRGAPDGIAQTSSEVQRHPRGNSAPVNQLPRRLLDRSADRIATGWTQGAEARTADGHIADPWSGTATSWSLLGALVAALEESSADEQTRLHALAQALDALARFVDDDSLAAWNDRSTQTCSHVLQTLNAAANVL
jgi:hypothetical protein